MSSSPQARLNWKASAFAALFMGGLMLLAKFVVNAPPPPEMLFNLTNRALGVPWVFNLIHALPYGLDAYAKYVLFGITIIAFLGVWWALGEFYLRVSRWSNPWLADLAYSFFMLFSVGLILLPLQGLGLFGLGSNNFQYPPVSTHAWALVFGLVFALVLHSSIGRRAVPYQDTRRQSLRTIIGGVAILGTLSMTGRFVGGVLAKAQEATSGLFASLKNLSPEITPTPEHYQVSKNVFNPEIRERGWSLKISGMVDEEVELTLDDLKALPAVERPSTLMCISNQVGGDLIGNSVWTGVKLADLLERAGVQDGASELILRAADNYSDSFPLDAALREGTILAYLQNGEPLTRDHGFPARVLVPGIYGMKNVKWVVEMELTGEDYQGYWQTRGWSDAALVQTMSRIDTARATMLEDGQAAIGGIAYAGLRGVQQVEVSVDGGKSWQAAQLKPALNDLSWNLWGFSWEAEPGTYEVLVRATDGTGETQTEERNRPLPDGATGYHRLEVTV